MKVLFPVADNYTITQDYYSTGNLDGATYKQKFGTDTHAGIDIQSFHGDPLTLCEDALAYKVWNLQSETLQQGLSSGFGVHFLTPVNSFGFCKEYTYWHTMSNTIPKEGDFVSQGSTVAYEGASGQVFANGVMVPDSQKGVPPYPGTHLHWSYRVVKQVTETDMKHLLQKRDTTPYQDKDGFYYEIQDYDNGNKGFLDPMKLDIIQYKDWLAEKLTVPPPPVQPVNTTPQASATWLGRIVAWLKKVASYLNS